MHPVLALSIRADDVCAYLWARADLAARATACAHAQVSDTASLLDWYALSKAERIPLMYALAAEIEISASRQRQARRNAAADIGTIKKAMIKEGDSA
jgi:hypothetical protein